MAAVTNGQPRKPRQGAKDSGGPDKALAATDELFANVVRHAGAAPSDAVAVMRGTT
jgi:hypothetical protein